MRRYEHIVARKIHDSFFLIDTKQNYLNDKCSLYEINEIGYFIWNDIDGSKTVEDIIQDLFSQIVGEVDYNELEYDVKVFLETLIANGFVEA